MVRLVGPQDIPYAELRVTRQAQMPGHDPGPEALAQLGEKTTEIVTRAREQQLNHRAAADASELRLRLAAAHDEVVNAGAPVGADMTEWINSIPQRFQARVEQIQQEISAAHGGGPPLYQRLYEERALPILTEYNADAIQSVARRHVDQSRAEFLTRSGNDRRNALDPEIDETQRAPHIAAYYAGLDEAMRGGDITAAESAASRVEFDNQLASVRRDGTNRAEAQRLEDDIFRDNPSDAVALQRARDIEDPLMRDTVMTRTHARIEENHTALAGQIRSAVGQATRILGTERVDENGVSRGGRLTDIPESLRHFLEDNDQWGGIVTYADAMAARGGLSGAPSEAESRARQNEILLEARMTQEQRVAQASARGEPVPYGDGQSHFAHRPDIATDPRLNDADRAELLHMQAVARGEVPATAGGKTAIDTAFDQTMEVVQQYANRHQIDIGSASTSLSVGRDDRERYARVQHFIMDRVRFIVAANGAPPTPAEMEQIAHFALRQTSPSNRRSYVYQGQIPEGERISVRAMPQVEYEIYQSQWVRDHGNVVPVSGSAEDAAMKSWIRQTYTDVLREETSQ